LNSSYIKASVACYFRYNRQYPIVSFERGYDYAGTYNPDILVINNKRYPIEIEVKVSLSDFKNDINKRIWNLREIVPDHYPMPYQFYYAVPYKLKDKVLPILDLWKNDGKIYGNVGLLIIEEKRKIGFNDLYVERKAPINKSCKRLTVKQVVKMVKNQSGTLCSMMIQIAKNKDLMLKSELDYSI